MKLANSARRQWLIDLSPELPSAQLDGFDVSEDQFPSKVWLLSHISLSQLDITKDVPRNLEGMYDVVHVQLFLCVVQKEGPTAIMNQLYKLLSASSLQNNLSVLILLVQSPADTSSGSNMIQFLSESCHQIHHSSKVQTKSMFR